MNNMKPIESYDITIDHDWGHLSLDVEEDQDGDWCKTAKVRQLEQEHQKAITIIQEVTTYLEALQKYEDVNCRSRILCLKQFLEQLKAKGE